MNNINNKLISLLNNNLVGAGNALMTIAMLYDNHQQIIIKTDKPILLADRKDYKQLSLKQVLTHVSMLAGWYQSRLVQPGDAIGIYINNSIEHVLHFFALNAIGAIPALMNGNLPIDIAIEYINKAKLKGVIIGPEQEAILMKHAQMVHCQFIVDKDNLTTTQPPVFNLEYHYQHKANDIVIIGHTSGTTGFPKAVPQRHAGLLFSFKNDMLHNHPLTCEQPLGTFMCALASAHIAMISYTLSALLLKAPYIYISDHRSQALLAAIEYYQPQTIVAFARTYVDILRLTPKIEQLSSISTWLATGDCLHINHIKQLIHFGNHHCHQATQSGSVVVSRFGSSEMGAALFALPISHGALPILRSIGTPKPWVDVKVLSEENQPLAPGQIGKLAVSAPSVTLGYWHNDILTKQYKPENFLLTGDIVYCDPLGNYIHLDRITDVIKTSAGTIYSLLAEDIILMHSPNIFECYIIAKHTANNAVNDVLAILITLHTRSQLTKAEIKFLNQQLNRYHMPSIQQWIVLSIDHLPLGVTGKVIKYLLRERYHHFITAFANY
jgi:long-chain acyl-CoA synthetase